jgi:hypothetical protein
MQQATSPKRDDGNPTDSVTDAERLLLMDEYKINVDLWKHDDTLRQQRTGNLLVFNAALLTGLGVATGLKPPLIYLAAVALFFSLIGVKLCSIWDRVHLRNAQYSRFRRFQLRSIEARLPALTTFRHTQQAFDKGAEVVSVTTTEVFTVAESATASSILSEGELPRLWRAVWSVAGTLAVLLLGFFLYAVLAKQWDLVGVLAGYR